MCYYCRYRYGFLLTYFNKNSGERGLQGVQGKQGEQGLQGIQGERLFFIQTSIFFTARTFHKYSLFCLFASFSGLPGPVGLPGDKGFVEYQFTIFLFSKFILIIKNISD